MSPGFMSQPLKDGGYRLCLSQQSLFVTRITLK